VWPPPPGAPERQRRQGIALVLLAALLWSSNAMFVKLLALEPLPLAALRCAVAGLALAPFIRPAAIRWSWALPALALCLTLNNLFFVAGNKWTTAANVIALQSAAPAWVFLGGCLLARRFPLRQLPPLALILAGVLALLQEPAHGSSELGNLLGLLSGVAFAGTTLIVPHVRAPVLSLAALANLGAAAILFLLDPWAFHLTQVTASQWLILAYVGVFQIGLPYVCYAAALRRIPPSQVQILTLLEPLLNPVWVFFALGEAPSGYGWAGGAFILAGILTDSWLRMRPPSR
jgi:drug/metabolite transporter (DMT)-like permease